MFSPPTAEAAGLNLRPGASCWKVGSYLLMPGGLQCTMQWFSPPVNYLSQYDLAVERDVKQQINKSIDLISLRFSDSHPRSQNAQSIIWEVKRS